MNVKGKTTGDLLNIDFPEFKEMSERELRSVVKRLADTSNKRIKRMEAAGYKTKAGKFTTKGKNINELRREYVRAKSFLQSGTGGLKEIAATQKRVVKGLKKEGININTGDYKKFWEVYEKLKELDPSIEAGNLKYRIMKDIAKELDTGEVDDVVNKIQDRISDIYEEAQELENEFFNTDDYFEMDEDEEEDEY